jgi:hypothetical protein
MESKVLTKYLNKPQINETNKCLAHKNHHLFIIIIIIIYFNWKKGFYPVEVVIQ